MKNVDNPTEMHDDKINAVAQLQVLHKFDWCLEFELTHTQGLW